MPKVNEIRTALFEAAPEYMKMEWDNVGLMCGHAAQEVTRVLVALDASYRVLNEAQAAHCELVVCHHPLIFGGTKTVTDETPLGRSLLFAIENGISVLSFHTNLDCAPEGVNDVLARSLGLSEVTVMEPAGTDEQGRAYGLIRTGTVPETDVHSFAAQVKQALGCEGLRYADGGRPVHRVAVGGGSCGSAIGNVLAHGCDTLVTADLKYHEFADAPYFGINLIDAGHFQTENPVCARLEALLRGQTDAGAEALRDLPFEGRLSVVEFLLHSLQTQLCAMEDASALAFSAESFLKSIPAGEGYAARAEKQLENRRAALQIRRECGVLSAEDERRETAFLARSDAALAARSDAEAFDAVRLLAESAGTAAEQNRKNTLCALENSLRFVCAAFGDEQELWILLHGLQDCGAAAFLQKENSSVYQELLSRATPEAKAAALREELSRGAGL